MDPSWQVAGYSHWCTRIHLTVRLFPTDEKYRGVRDVLLLDGIAASLVSKLQLASGPLLAATLAALAVIPHYDARLYDETASLLLLRRAARDSGNDDGGGDGGGAAAEAPLQLHDVLTFVWAFSRVQHRSKSGKAFMMVMMDRAEEVGVC